MRSCSFLAGIYFIGDSSFRMDLWFWLVNITSQTICGISISKASATPAQSEPVWSHKKLDLNHSRSLRLNHRHTKENWLDASVQTACIQILGLNQPTLGLQKTQFVASEFRALGTRPSLKHVLLVVSQLVLVRSHRKVAIGCSQEKGYGDGSVHVGGSPHPKMKLNSIVNSFYSCCPLLLGCLSSLCYAVSPPICQPSLMVSMFIFVAEYPHPCPCQAHPLRSKSSW